MNNDHTRRLTEQAIIARDETFSRCRFGNNLRRDTHTPLYLAIESLHMVAGNEHGLFTTALMASIRQVMSHYVDLERGLKVGPMFYRFYGFVCSESEVAPDALELYQSAVNDMPPGKSSVHGLPVWAGFVGSTRIHGDDAGTTCVLSIHSEGFNADMVYGFYYD